MRTTAPPVGPVPSPGGLAQSAPPVNGSQKVQTLSGQFTPIGHVRVGDALHLINGRAFKPTEWAKSGVPIVRIQNLNDSEAPFNYYQGHLPDKFRLQSGDLLFAW